MAAEGRELVQPLVPGVGPFPVEPPLLRVAERARLPHPVGRLAAHDRVRLESGPHPGIEWQPGLDLAVHPGEGRPEVRRQLRRVPEHREPAAGPQHPRRLGRAGDRVHPVPGLGGDDRVEFPAGAVPRLERRDLGLDSASPRQFGHPGVGIDPEHPAASRQELAGRDAGTAADVKHGTPRAGGDDPVDHGPGIAGPGPVITLRVRAERLGDLSRPMRLLPGKTP